MLNYHDTHGQLPPAVVYGADSRPLYSWRVLLLPFLEHDDLYREFHSDEPWDSPHNRALLPRMPALYRPPPGKASRLHPYHTILHVFVGPGTAFESREGLRLPVDFPDGVGNTLLIVEAGEPVRWTQPADLAFDPDGPLPELRLLFKDGFRAVMADASVRWIPANTSLATLRAAITRNGNDDLGPDW
jgi:hypothetical protein